MGFWGSLLNVASFIPGPQQPFVAGAAALNQARNTGGGGGGGGGLGQLASLYGPISGAISLGRGQQLNAEALGAQREALNFARQRNAETAPFRQIALRDLTAATPNAPSLADAYLDPTNPFSRPVASLNLSQPGLGGTDSKKTLNPKKEAMADAIANIERIVPLSLIGGRDKLQVSR